MRAWSLRGTLRLVGEVSTFYANIFKVFQVNYVTVEIWKSLRIPHIKSKPILQDLSRLPSMHLDVVLEVRRSFFSSFTSNLANFSTPDSWTSASTHASASLAREQNLPPTPSLSHHRFDVAEFILGGSSTPSVFPSDLWPALGEAFIRPPYMRCA